MYTYRQIKYISIFIQFFYTLCIMNKISDKVMQERKKTKEIETAERGRHNNVIRKPKNNPEETAVFLIPPPF